MTTTITRIALDQLHESPFNPRKTFRDAGLQELASDIQAQGILSPLLVRPRIPELFRGLEDAADTAACGYELVFGHRRLRAAQLAGVVDVPCMVQSMSDGQVKRAQISENLSREDVHPIEEAEGYQALIADGSETADSLAARYGKSRSYIYARLTLLKACPEVRSACVAGDIGAEVALLISRLRTDKLQGQALSRIKARNHDLKDGGTRSFREIRDLLREDFTLSLSKDCLFDVSDALLLPNADACTTCPKRSGNAPEFEDLATDQPGRWAGHPSKGDAYLCTDPDCYAAKKAAHLSAQAAKLRDSGTEVIDGNKARAAIDAHGRVKGSFMSIQDARPLIAQAKKAAKADPRMPVPQVVTIQDPRSGKTHQAVRIADLEATGLASKDAIQQKAKAANQQTDWEALQKERQKRAEAETARRRAMLDVVRSHVASHERTAFDLRLVACAAVRGVPYNGRQTLHSLWAVDDTEALTDLIEKLDLASVTRLVMDCALVRDVDCGYYPEAERPEALESYAREYGIDIESARALAPADPPLAPAARAPEEVGVDDDDDDDDEADEASALVAAWPVRKSDDRDVRYRNDATGESWTGRGLKPRWLTAALENGRSLSEFELSTPSEAARAPAEASVSEAAGLADENTAGCAVEEQTDEAGFAGQEQKDDAGVTAVGSDAEVES